MSLSCCKFVANFIGRANFIPAVVLEEKDKELTVKLGDQVVILDHVRQQFNGREVTVEALNQAIDEARGLVESARQSTHKGDYREARDDAEQARVKAMEARRIAEEAKGAASPP